MTTILRKLPFSPEPSEVTVADDRVRVKAHQIIVWVSVSAPGVSSLAANCPRLPAILDTGSTFTFSIRESLLRQWAGIHPQFLRQLGSIREGDRRLPLHVARLWLHRNQPGKRDVLADLPPFRLELKRGIAVYPEGMAQAPRLPLLGLRRPGGEPA